MSATVPDTGYLLAGLAVMFAVTFALRALPFAFLAPLRDSLLLRYLGAHLPAGLMVVLTVYAVTGLETGPGPVSAAALALAVTTGLHLWRARPLLSIVGGTAVYIAALALWG